MSVAWPCNVVRKAVVAHQRSFARGTRFGEISDMNVRPSYRKLGVGFAHKAIVLLYKARRAGTSTAGGMSHRKRIFVSIEA